MLRKLIVIITSAAIVLGVASSNALSSETTNVAFGKTVATKGEFFTGGWGNGLIVDNSSLTDSVFFEKNHQWDQGPIWWQEDMDAVQNSLTVFLGATYKIRELIIQVDNNDNYLISWEDENLGSMVVPVVPELGYGMDTPIRIKVKAVTSN